MTRINNTTRLRIKLNEWTKYRIRWLNIILDVAACVHCITVQCVHCITVQVYTSQHCARTVYTVSLYRCTHCIRALYTALYMCTPLCT